MSKFQPEKLNVSYKDEIRTKTFLFPRKYTLTHSDESGELFLSIGKNYDFDQINYNIRDEVLVFINGENNEVLGAYNKEKNVLGTYLHGIFDKEDFLLKFINDIREAKGLKIIENEILDYRVYKLKQYNELAKLFEENINIERVIKYK